MASSGFRRLLIPYGSGRSQGRPETFRAWLPGEQTAWDYAAEFTLTPAEGSTALTASDRMGCQEWARATAAAQTGRFPPPDWIQAANAANRALREGGDCRPPCRLIASVVLEPLPESVELARQRQVMKTAADSDRQMFDGMRRGIFTEPGLAHVWWVVKHPEWLPDVESLEGFLRSMRSSEVNTASRFHGAVASIAESFLTGLDQAQLDHLVNQFEHVFRSYGRTDLQAEARGLRGPADPG